MLQLSPRFILDSTEPSLTGQNNLIHPPYYPHIKPTFLLAASLKQKVGGSGMWLICEMIKLQTPSQAVCVIQKCTLSKKEFYYKQLKDAQLYKESRKCVHH